MNNLTPVKNCRMRCITFSQTRQVFKKIKRTQSATDKLNLNVVRREANTAKRNAIKRYEQKLVNKRISNQCKVFWLFMFPAGIKNNQSKMKELEWSQYFPNCNPIGATCCHGNHCSDLI